MDASVWELPHWIPWLGGVLKKEGFSKVRSLNLQSAAPYDQKLEQSQIAKELMAEAADVYLHSPMTPNLHFALEMAELAKKTNAASINVFGGVIATPLHEQIAKHPAVDYVVRDRGEFALPALLNNLSDPSKVKNLTYRKGNELHVHPELYPYIEPKDLPFPFYDIFPKQLGAQLRYIRQNYAIGCPFKCSFCTIQTIGRKPGYFPIERVLKEIKAYRDHYGEHHNIYFGDETFTLNQQKTLEICDALKRQGNITYDMQTRLMSLNSDRVMKALQESGCKWVEVGVETISQKSMKVHKQGTNLSYLENILKRLRDCNLPVCSFIVNGLPEQTVDEMRRSIDHVCELIDKQLLHATYFFGLVPYPGSAMYANPGRYGLKIKTHDYRLYNEDIEPVYDTPNATSKEIYRVFLEGVEKLGQAMDPKPLLGEELPSETLQNLGRSLAHI